MNLGKRGVRGETGRNGERGNFGIYVIYERIIIIRQGGGIANLIGKVGHQKKRLRKVGSIWDALCTQGDKFLRSQHSSF